MSDYSTLDAYRPKSKDPKDLYSAYVGYEWSNINSLALFKQARAAYSSKLSSAKNSPPLTGQKKENATRKASSLKTDISRLKSLINEAQRRRNVPGISDADDARLVITLHNLTKELAAATSELDVINAQIKPRTTSKPSTPRNTPAQPKVITDNRLQYNVGSVSEAYFTSRTEFLLEKANTDKLASAVENNRPSPSLTSALELWNNGKASKGMFVTWRDISTKYDADRADGAMDAFLGTNEKLPPHAFRFQYNPGSISMSYAGTPLVDPNFEAAGLDKFNLTGTGVTQSTIQFQLLINRMYDMKYYIREDEQIPDGEGGFNSPGTLRPEARDVYGEEFVSPEIQRAIYNMGTMYDLEFLLRTIMGYTMKSSLRDYSFLGGGTADMGFLGARPVELHLGKNMRYLGYITGINVEHVIFDIRMVPLFSNVSLSFSRLPDYQSTNPQNQPQSPTGFTGSEDYRRSRNR